MMGKISEKVKRGVIFGCGALLLLATTSFFFVSLAHHKDAQRWSNHTYNVISEIDGLIENTLISTRRTRRFVLTGYKKDRREAYQALNAMRSHLSELQQKTRDNPQQQALLRDVATLVPFIERDFNAVLSQRSLFRTPLSMSPVDAESTVRNIEELMSKLQQIKSAERALLEKRSARASATQLQSDFWLGMTTLTLGGVMIAMISQILRDSSVLSGQNILLQQEISERESAQNELGIANENLEERVQRRTAELEQLNYNLLLEIKEREQAEKALRFSEQRYHSLVVTTAQIIWTTTAGGLVEDIPLWRDFTGQSLEEVAGYGWIDALHPDDKAKTAQAWLQAVESRVFYQVEFRIRRHDGVYRHFVSRGIPVIEKGEVVEWVGTCTDIEDEKRAEQALRQAQEELEDRVRERTLELAQTNEALQYEIAERLHITEALRISEEGYREIVENSNDLIFKTDALGHFVFFNQCMKRMMGYSDSEVLGQHFTRLVHPDYRRAALRFFTRQRRHKISDTYYEFPVLTRKGVTIWLGQNTHLIREGAESFAFQGAARDITERIKAQEQLRESEERFKRLADGTFEAVAVTQDGTVRDANDKFLEMFGYDLSSVRGMKVEDFITPEHLPRVLEAIRTGREAPYEAIGVRADGTKISLEICGKAIPYYGGEARITSIRDITQRKEVDRMKSEFVSTVSHELRTPLTSIRGALGLMVGGVAGELPERAKSMSQIALNNSERLIRLINDILDIEKIESGAMVLQLSPLDLRESVHAAMEANKSYSEELGVTFKLRIEPGEEKNGQESPSSTRASAAEDAFGGFGVYADGDRLTQVLTNLLGNAAKFSFASAENRAEVQVVVERLTDSSVHENEFHEREHLYPSPAVDLSSAPLPVSSWLRVSIIDQGSGVAPGFRNRLFGKFAQGDASDTRKKGGTGLGLSISRAIVEKLGGRIGFYNNEEKEAGAKGATFFFELPRLLAVPGEKAPKTPTRVLASARNQKRRLLVCEDDREIAVMLRLMLEQCGFDVDIARDASHAKTKLKTAHYAGMTLDLMLPDQDGISLLRELRADPATAELPIIVISAKAEIGRGEMSGDAIGVIDWLEKPIDARRLAGVVRRATALTPRSEQPRILHVEDNPDLIQVVAGILDGLAEISYAGTLQEARSMLSREHFDLILLDMNLPDGNGLQLMAMADTFPPTPVVVFSASDIDLDIAGQVAGVLVKSRTSNQDLLATLTSILERNGLSPQPDAPGAVPAKA